jgi:salicylate hydroxylase
MWKVSLLTPVSFRSAGSPSRTEAHNPPLADVCSEVEDRVRLGSPRIWASVLHIIPAEPKRAARFGRTPTSTHLTPLGTQTNRVVLVRDLRVVPSLVGCLFCLYKSCVRPSRYCRLEETIRLLGLSNRLHTLGIPFKHIHKNIEQNGDRCSNQNVPDPYCWRRYRRLSYSMTIPQSERPNTPATLQMLTQGQAIALRGPQREIVVLEKSRMNKEVGALLSLQPNAQKIVEQWGLGDIIQKAKPTAERQFRILDTKGKIHMKINMDAKKYGADRMVYHRQDLHEALREAALSKDLPGHPASIVTAAKVVSCDCEAGVVTLEDNTTYQGDLVIGADGIHSVIREAILKAGNHELVHPTPTGVSAYRLLVETANLSSINVDPEIFDAKKQATTLMMGHDRRVIMGPARNGDLLGLVGMVPDEHMHEASNSNSWTTPGSLSKLLETYEDFPQWVRDIFAQAPDIALWQLRDIDALPAWVAGRCIIIGDAAHAMLPTQGQ